MVAGSSKYSSFIIDSRASRHMASIEDFFSAMYYNSGPSIRIGDDSEIQAKGIGRIDLDDGYLNNVLFVPNLAVKLLSFFQMTHTGETRRVKFTPDIVEIEKISTNKVVSLGFVNHHARCTNYPISFPTLEGMCFYNIPMIQEGYGMRDMAI